LEALDVCSSLAQSRPHARDPNANASGGGETLPRNSPVSVDLPPPGVKRWVIRRKAAVVAAVRSGAIGLEEACRRFELSEEEFHAWERGFDRHGVAGLRVTRLQVYRDTPSVKRRTRDNEHC
jgi:Protein of unknown function (DUF1153)